MKTNVKDHVKPLVNDRFFTIEDAAKQVGSVGAGVVYRLVATGQLGSVRVGRRIMIPESDLNQYLTNQYKPAS